MNTSHEHDPAARIEDELLRVLARQAIRVPVPVMILAGIIAALAATALPVGIWGTWLGLVAFMQVTRLVVLTRLPRMDHYSHQLRLRIAAMLSLINGFVMASSLYAFPFLTEFERAVQTMLLAGLAAGTVVTSAGYRSIYLSFLLPIFVPMFFLWALQAGNNETGWRNISVAALVFLFGAILYAVAKDSYKLFSESFTIRSEQMKLNRQLRRALDEADAANKAKTRFLASASHDLRQPLHTLSLYSAALAKRPLDDRSKDIAKHMNVALEVLGTQLDALLDISRLDAGVVKPNFEAVNLFRLLDRVAGEFRPSAQEKGLRLLLDCPPSLTVRTDQTLLSQVVVNLVSNAVKYTDSGEISISAAPAAGAIALRVSDTGQGIPADQHIRVFEEFYQLSNPHRDRAAGFGLGLSIVRRMVGLLNIELVMRSTVGSGTTFELSLPTAVAEEPLAESETSVPVTLHGITVLAVDDEAEVRRGTQTLLESLGCEVTTAEGREQAVSAVQRNRPDVMLFDFRLRDGEDGLDTLRAVRAVCPDLPAIMISGDTAPDRLREANAAGIELLHKPVAGDELQKAIAAACNRRGDTVIS